MSKHINKVQLKRVLRRRKRQALELTEEANRQLDKHVFSNTDHLKATWRLIISWTSLVALLIAGVAVQARALGRYYIESKPVDGGSYIEAMVGRFTNANPMFASSPTDTSVSRLVFSGLLKYNEEGKLVGDLAETWEVDSKATTYTVHLKPHLKWHDGQPLTASDVVYTIQTIQNPDTRSPYNLSWQGIQVAAPNDRTVVFSLPSPLTSFPYSLVFGVVPQHLLAKVPVAQLRSASFNNQAPIGSGPFQWQSVLSLAKDAESTHQQIILTANDHYYFGRPKLDHFTVETYGRQDEVESALAKGLANAAVLPDAPSSDQLSQRDYVYRSIPLMSGVYIFWNNSQPLLADKTLRQALTRSVDSGLLRNDLGYPVLSVDEPFLKLHSSYDPARRQLSYSLADANELFDKAGWTRSGTVRQKASALLEFSLLTEDNAEFIRVANHLQRQMADVGVKLTVDVKSGREFQLALLSHQYDSLLYGVGIGADPDVYAYWHSSQATTDRYNFSNYQSAVADTALASARTRPNGPVREAKYRAFLDAWRDDAPAVGLYQPRLLYVSRGQIYNMSPKYLGVAVDRYANVSQWEINTAKVPKLER